MGFLLKNIWIYFLVVVFLDTYLHSLCISAHYWILAGNVTTLSLLSVDSSQIMNNNMKIWSNKSQVTLTNDQSHLWYRKLADHPTDTIWSQLNFANIYFVCLWKNRDKMLFLASGVYCLCCKILNDFNPLNIWVFVMQTERAI